MQRRSRRQREVVPSGKFGQFRSVHLHVRGRPVAVRLAAPPGIAFAMVRNYRVRKVGSSGTAKATYAGFYSPSHNLSCEMADRDVRGSYVYCQSVKAPKNVRMSLDGHLKICRGTPCLGNPAENTAVLGYGKKVTIGRFGCLSKRSGIRCTVVRSGKGFLIGSKRVRRVAS